MFTGERRKEGGGWRSVGPWWANSSLFAKFDEVIPESTSQDYSTTNLKKATTRFFVRLRQPFPPVSRFLATHRVASRSCGIVYNNTSFDSPLTFVAFPYTEPHTRSRDTRGSRREKKVGPKKKKKNRAASKLWRPRAAAGSQPVAPEPTARRASTRPPFMSSTARRGLDLLVGFCAVCFARAVSACQASLRVLVDRLSAGRGCPGSF